MRTRGVHLRQERWAQLAGKKRVGFPSSRETITCASDRVVRSRAISSAIVNQSETKAIDPEKFPGLLVVYTGNGKGKTTAALGMVFRALGRDFPVAVMQFIKGKWKTGERNFAASLPQLTFEVMGRGFTWESDDLRKDEALAQHAWARVKEWLASGDYRLVVLDELTYLCTWGWIDQADVIATIQGRPDHVNVVVTGRDAPRELIDIADTVTEMVEVKHAYQQGIRAKRGIDY